MQYQMFIKKAPTKSRLGKTFLLCKIKIKRVIKIMNQLLWAVAKEQPLT